jgi:hypothetical protein
LNLLLKLLEVWSEPPCGARPCPAWLVVLYHLANLAITACYLAIPSIVLYYWRYRRDGIAPAKLWMVIAFLPAQALSRLVRIDGFSGIPFCVFAVLDTLAAVVTINSVVWLRPKILHILRLPSRDELHRLNNELHEKMLEIQVMHLEEQRKNATLLAEVEKFRRAPSGPAEQSWVMAKHAALDRIVDVIKKAG